MGFKHNVGATLMALAFAVPAVAAPMTGLLRLKEKVTMEELAANYLNPSHPHYRIPYSPLEIRKLAGPTEQEYTAILNKVSQLGLQVIGDSPTWLWIKVKGDSSAFTKVFSTKLSFLGNVHRQIAPVRMPAGLEGVATVIGLNNDRKAHSKVHMLGAQPKDVPDGVPQETIKTAYQFDAIYKAGVSGQGQDIAVATYGGLNLDDVRFFYTYSKLSPAPVVDQVEFNGTPDYQEDYAMETQLDAEFAGMMAPGANVHVFGSATNDDAGEVAMFTAILDDNRAKVVNYSWGSCEDQLTDQHKQDMEKVFARAVAQGVNIMVASGDSGSDSCQDGSIKADWPAANPNVVAVGGTTFSQNKDGGTFSESAWRGSGGGISAIWDLPSFQSNLGTPYLKRSYPDVAFNADPQSGQSIYVHYNGVAGWVTIGGTSMAAPQWSGFLALVGQVRAKANKQPIGYINPLIYALTPTQSASLFNDVTTGNNGAYTAGAGWDAVTGVGSMQAAPLLGYFNSL